MANKFKKGDEVIVISGSSRGRIGKIVSVTGERVVVEGANIATIHKKPTSQNPGQIVKIERSIHGSNISHVENGSPVKVKFVMESGKKERISKKSGKKIG